MTKDLIPNGRGLLRAGPLNQGGDNQGKVGARWQQPQAGEVRDQRGVLFQWSLGHQKRVDRPFEPRRPVRRQHGRRRPAVWVGPHQDDVGRPSGVAGPAARAAEEIGHRVEH